MALVTICVAVCSLDAQSQPQTEPPASKVVAHVDVVNVVFTVTDDRGRLVTDMTRGQFSVLDNNRPPREVLAFEAQTGLPLRVGLLIDASNSVRDRFRFEQQAASEFLRQMLAPGSDMAMVESFDQVYEVVQDFTNDIDKLSASLRRISPRGSTAMWDAVYYACREKLMKLQNRVPVRNVIVLISDGNDTQSHVFPQEAIDMAQRAGVTVYTISTGLDLSNTEGNNNLTKLAEATGGQAFFPQKVDEVVSAFVHIRHELRSQYVISYTPDNFQANGQFRTVSIKTVGPGFNVRAKKGYYARNNQ